MHAYKNAFPASRHEASTTINTITTLQKDKVQTTWHRFDISAYICLEDTKRVYPLTYLLQYHGFEVGPANEKNSSFKA
jgi:hypothetical protein